LQADHWRSACRKNLLNGFRRVSVIRCFCGRRAIRLSWSGGWKMNLLNVRCGLKNEMMSRLRCARMNAKTIHLCAKSFLFRNVRWMSRR
jgi:hypothetical protein